MVVSDCRIKGSRAGTPRHFYRETAEKVRALSGVESAGGKINHLPLAGEMWGWLSSSKVAETRPGESRGGVRIAHSGLSATMRITVLQGPGHSRYRTMVNALVVLINEEAARTYGQRKIRSASNQLTNEETRPCGSRSPGVTRMPKTAPGP